MRYKLYATDTEGESTCLRQDTLVNLICPEPLKGFRPKLTQILSTLGPQIDYVLKVIGSE